MNGSRPTWLALLAALALPGCGTSSGVPVAAEKQQRPFAFVASGKAPAAAPVIVDDVVNGFDFLYRFITETEFVLCLEGRFDNGRVRVDGFRLARIDATSATHVRYQPCSSERYIGTAHNHPPPDRQEPCAPSDLDRRSFTNDTRAVIDIVLCGEGRYTWALKGHRYSVAQLPDAAQFAALTPTPLPRPTD